MRIILASTSPRRRALLAHLNVAFDVIPSEIVERDPDPAESAVDYSLALARAKVGKVAAQHGGRLVLGADTVVSIDSEIFGKPTDEPDARRMLRCLRDRVHQVVTAVAVRHDDIECVGAISATVRMRPYSDDDIEQYVMTGEPMDKAGAYAVQGDGARLVERVTGCYNAVVGLPLCITDVLLFASSGKHIDNPGARCKHTP